MIPLIPALALAFFSFLCSAFVVLRIVIPILPPHPLSRRVAPSEFGLPNFRSLSAADQSHVWLASLDILALCIFVWEVISEYIGGPTGYETGQQPLPSVRLWFILTARQTCLLVVAGLTLLHIRLGRSVSFGQKHWMVWGPSSVLILTSTGVAGILSAAGLDSLFIGLAAYSSSLAILSSAAFISLAVTLLVIRRNLSSSMNGDSDPWSPMRQVEEKPRPSFATEEIDALRDGASWITSNASTRRDSVSAWSFSTHHTVTTSRHSGRPQTASHPSIPAKSSYWFGTSTSQLNTIPPVPPLPSQYGPLSPTSESLAEPDPFRRIPSPLPQHPRERFLGSQNSWLSSSNESHTTLSAWSFPATQAESVHNASSPNLHTTLLPSSAAVASRPVTPALSNAQVLGGYGYKDSEKEGGSAPLPDTALDVSVYRSLGWLILIWIPLGLSLPYLITLSQNIPTSLATSILLTLSVTMSSPILALSILFRAPIPIPSGLFDAPNDLPTNLLRGATPTSDTVKWSREYKRSGSITVVEGRRSGDVWLSNGDAADGKGKVSRALGMMSPMPKLSVLPLEENEDEPTTPPLPIQDGDSSMPVNLHSRSYSETSAQFGRIRKDSKASSYFSGADESIAFASKIMIAQKHYSALAQTIHVNGSPERGPAAGAHLFLDGPVASTSAVDVPASGNNRASQHLRTRSVTSVNGPPTPTFASFNASPSPPPAFPLPPTPPSVRAARLAKHKKSYSSISAGKFSFGPVDDMNEIDALTAGVLPLLVPGLKVGDDMKIRDSPPATWRKRARAELEISRDRSRSRSTSRTRGEGKAARILKALNEFGEDFSSPQMHSTPARTRAGASKAKEPRGRKTSAHKRNHFSLPSLGLGRDGVQSLSYWSNELGRAIDNRFGQYTAVPSNVEFRRNTVFGAQSIPNDLTNLRATQEEIVQEIVHQTTTRATPLGRAMSTRSLGLRAEVPHNVDTARSSFASMNNNVPPSAASTVTLFEDFVNGMETGPQAESTPHNNVAHKRVSEDTVPPLPSSNHYTTSTASNRNSVNKNRSSTNSNRRSSIVYIKSDENATVTPPNATSTSSTSAMSSLAQWSSRAVRPLMPKSSKLQRKASKALTSAPNTSKLESPRGGLRPLSLLQERDTNSVAGPGVQAVNSKGTRPLALAKKEGAAISKKARARPSDENASPDAPRSRSNKHNLKPLNLARSDTNKMRAILRQDELLPDVVVRPPSTTEHQVYAYTFRD
ncbi:hypothetical protein GGU10DRAFT_8349 [Lentinula aff. detonsa]|uniref:Uncharacterized protein n=1 Tax=Lentinula aff. detonsa TaxID=2804958 RepID=A0AA38KG56_9AGAR|nr:hypothetical protein GGU10DRAFT_8349 [Lentinula aff. detonsa]